MYNLIIPDNKAAQEATRLVYDMASSTTGSYFILLQSCMMSG